MWDEDLVRAAESRLATAGTGRHHSVAAAVRDSTGHVHTGVNLYHFTGGPCAEMVALANALGEGASPARIVAIGDAGRGVVAPCGRCRQVMADCFPGIEVLLPGGRTEQVDLLLPDLYRWSESPETGD